mmetsp:Transcript_90385/g.281405  ORF Transcript_90385/g.281405 Transcript_90385/m.281405 type:complete len:103 (-) Transcript_90385:291-599(-)
MAGHRMPFHTNKFRDQLNRDYDYDGGPYLHQLHSGIEAKRSIWLSKALYGVDQLRQRMACALSQIITVATFDEAREIMQIYPIGIWKVKRDGTKVKDSTART